MSAAVSRLLLRRAPWPELVPLWLACCGAFGVGYGDSVFCARPAAPLFFSGLLDRHGRCLELAHWRW